MKIERWLDAIDKGDYKLDFTTINYQKDGCDIEVEMLRDAIKVRDVRESASAETMQLVADKLGLYLPTAYLHEVKWRQADYQLPPVYGKKYFGKSHLWSCVVDELLEADDSSVGSVSGYCKVWVLDDLNMGDTGNPASAKAPRGINHGFMVPTSAVRFNRDQGRTQYRGINVAQGVYTDFCIQKLGTRHGLHQDDYSQAITDLVATVKVDGAFVPVDLFYTMYAAATHRKNPLSYSRHPGVPAFNSVCTRRSHLDKVTSFGEAVLAAALRDHALGVREDLAPNDGTRIREYAKRYNLQPPLNWCGVAVGTWIREAATRIGVDPPIPGSPAAQAYVGQFKDPLNIAVEFFDANEVLANRENILPGSIVVWRRPPLSWTGHVGVLKSPIQGDGYFETVEANSGPLGDEVAEMERNVVDPQLLGIGVWRHVRKGGHIIELPVDHDPLEE